MKKFENMKILRKLITGFLVVAIIAAIIGVVGITGMQVINRADTDLYELQTAPLADFSYLTDSISAMRIQLREIVINSGNLAAIQTSEDKFNENLKIYRSKVEIYKPSIHSAEIKQSFAEAEKLFDEYFIPLSNEVFRLAKVGDLNGAYKALTTDPEKMIKMLDNFDLCLKNRIENAKATSDSNSNLASILSIVLIIVIILGLASSILLGIYIAKMISRPINKMVDIANKLAIGDIDVDIDINREDEIGILAQSFNKMIDGIKEQVDIVSKIAEKDISFKVTSRSDKDIMGISLEKTIEGLNKMFNDINQASMQVAEGSNQVSYGAQALSQGSTEQASSIEELAITINEIAEHINKNAKNAEDAKHASLDAASEVEKGSKQINDMIDAMQNINEESIKIGKIIKTIEDIAFQTNILALNAAVEAARAGSAGRGFAVVADEVRNLATKSSEAAKNTTQLIENSMSAVTSGTMIAEKTGVSLINIVKKTNASTKLIEEIAAASEQQAVGASQITVGIEQISAVVQTNSATAEESAAASEELSSQAEFLKEQINTVKLRQTQEI